MGSVRLIRSALARAELQMVEPFAVLPDTSLHGIGLGLGLAPVVAADRRLTQALARVAVTVERLIERLGRHPAPGEKRIRLGIQIRQHLRQAQHARPRPEQALPDIAARGQDILATPAQAVMVKPEHAFEEVPVDRPQERGQRRFGQARTAVGIQKRVLPALPPLKREPPPIGGLDLGGQTQIG